MAEFLTVLSEFPRVTKQLEADRKVNISRSSRCLRELYDTFRIMADAAKCTSDEGKRRRLAIRFQEEVGEIPDLHIQDTGHMCRMSCAPEDIAQNDARRIRLQHHDAKDLANTLELELPRRLSNLWETVDENVA